MIVMVFFAAIGFAWLHYEIASAESRRITVERLREFPGYVVYSSDPDETVSTDQSSTNAEVFKAWLTKQLGVDFTHQVDLICVEGGNEYTDADLVATCRLNDLTSLRLGRTTVTDKGIEHVAQLEQLERLSISSPHLTDRAMTHIAKLSNLKRLALYDAAVTDQGIAQLAVLTSLEHVDLNYTQVTEKGVADLREVLPKCEIFFDE